MCNTPGLNSSVKKFPIAESDANVYIVDVKNRATRAESPAAGRFAMEMIELAPLETMNLCDLESVTRHLSELDEEDRYSVIYEIARIQTLIGSIADDSNRSAA
jgi:hypothetical protein